MVQVSGKHAFEPTDEVTLCYSFTFHAQTHRPTASLRKYVRPDPLMLSPRLLNATRSRAVVAHGSARNPTSTLSIVESDLEYMVSAPTVPVQDYPTAVSSLGNHVQESHGVPVRSIARSVVDTHDVVVSVLNPLAGAARIRELQAKVDRIQHELHQAHVQTHESERRLLASLEELEGLERAQFGFESTLASPKARALAPAAPRTPARSGRGIRSSLKPPEALREFWFPAAFSSTLTPDTLVPFELFGLPWVLFRDKDGRRGNSPPADQPWPAVQCTQQASW